LRVNIGAVVVLVVLLVVPATRGARSAESSRAKATVERVIDGDTLVVRGGARVRLVQIDAPEAGEECYAGASTLELVRLAGAATRVELEIDPVLDQVDRYGRLLRYVHASGRNVNLELVRRGAATPWFYDGDRGRYAARFLAATNAARAARRGMWGACRVSWMPDGPVVSRPWLGITRPRDVRFQKPDLRSGDSGPQVGARLNR
jgi:endonuclease YncB( thermonuclease family)